MNDSTSNRSQGRIPTDAQMDGLLREFFRLEMPEELNRPFRRASAAVDPGLTLTVVQAKPQTAASHPRSGRFAVISALAVLALSVVVFVETRHNGTPTGSPVTNTVTEPLSPLTPNEDLMLVSPKGDSADHKTAVGADGLTLEETDHIELTPPRPARPE